MDAFRIQRQARDRSTVASTRCMLNGMGSKRVRVDEGTYEQLERLAAELGGTVGTTVALAVRALRRERIAHELSTPLRHDEARWLEGDLG